MGMTGYPSHPPPSLRVCFPRTILGFSLACWRRGATAGQLNPTTPGGSLWGLRTAPPGVLSSFSSVQGQSQKSLLQDLHSVQLLPQELEQNTEYEFQVRSRPASSYQGTWSDWSPRASFKTTHKGEAPPTPSSAFHFTARMRGWGGQHRQSRHILLTSSPFFGLLREQGQPGFSWVTQLSSQSREASL